MGGPLIDKLQIRGSILPSPRNQPLFPYHRKLKAQKKHANSDIFALFQVSLLFASPFGPPTMVAAEGDFQDRAVLLNLNLTWLGHLVNSSHLKEDQLVPDVGELQIRFPLNLDMSLSHFCQAFQIIQLQPELWKLQMIIGSWYQQRILKSYRQWEKT